MYQFIGLLRWEGNVTPWKISGIEKHSYNRRNSQMKISIVGVLLLLIFTTACEWTPSPLVPSTQGVEPSRTPSILIPTSPVPLPTHTPIFEQTPSQTPKTTVPTHTASPAATLTSTPAALLQAEIIGCNTSLDITHQMGEVTNAFAMIQNFSSLDLTGVCATLFAIDEDREHPDKTACVELLPSRNQVLFKLTVDTQFQIDTYIRVDAVTDQGLSVSVMKESCQDIGLFQGDPDETGAIKPIP